MKRFLSAGEGYVQNSLTYKLLLPFTRYIQTSSPNKFGWLAYPSWVAKVTGMHFLVALFKSFLTCNFSTLRTSCIYLGLFFMCLQAAIANQPDPETDRAVLVAPPFQTDSIHPLQVGDKVPDEFWTYSHLFLEGSETTTKNLQQFKDNYILIYFWESYCKPCISKLPVLDSLYNANYSDLEIVLVNSKRNNGKLDRIGNVLERQSEQLPFGLTMSKVVEDDYLSDLFPYVYLSTFVLIDKSGMVLLNENLDDISDIEAILSSENSGPGAFSVQLIKELQ